MLTFGMFEGKLTRVGDRCSFATLIAELDLRVAGLPVRAEIIHGIDLELYRRKRGGAP